MNTTTVKTEHKSITFTKSTKSSSFKILITVVDDTFHNIIFYQNYVESLRITNIADYICFISLLEEANNYLKENFSSYLLDYNYKGIQNDK